MAASASEQARVEPGSGPCWRTPSLRTGARSVRVGPRPARSPPAMPADGAPHGSETWSTTGTPAPFAAGPAWRGAAVGPHHVGASTSPPCAVRRPGRPGTGVRRPGTVVRASTAPLSAVPGGASTTPLSAAPGVASTELVRRAHRTRRGRGRTWKATASRPTGVLAAERPSAARPRPARTAPARRAAPWRWTMAVAGSTWPLLAMPMRTPARAAAAVVGQLTVGLLAAAQATAARAARRSCRVGTGRRDRRRRARRRHRRGARRAGHRAHRHRLPPPVGLRPGPWRGPAVERRVAGRVDGADRRGGPLVGCRRGGRAVAHARACASRGRGVAGRPCRCRSTSRCRCRPTPRRVPPSPWSRCLRCRSRSSRSSPPPVCGSWAEGAP